MGCWTKRRWLTCVRWRIAPIGIDPAGRVMLATAGPPTTAMRQDVARSLSQEPGWHVVRESEIAGALRVMRPNETVTGTDAVPLLGDLLLRMGLVRRDALDPVLSHYQPEEDGRIGDFLVAQGVVTRMRLSRRWRPSSGCLPRRGPR